MPLDLHVLGLPLAFILSQDQTLHCQTFNISKEFRTIQRPPTSKWSSSNFTLSLQYVYELLNQNPSKKQKKENLLRLHWPFRNALPYQLSGCKYRELIFSPQIVLGNFFEIKIDKIVSRCFSRLIKFLFPKYYEKKFQTSPNRMTKSRYG